MNQSVTSGSTRNLPRFPLGQVVATPGALALLERYGLSASTFLARHVRGDWGDVSPEDAAANDQAITAGHRVLSAYVVGDTRIWITSEWDRSVTTVLMPSEY